MRTSSLTFLRYDGGMSVRVAVTAWVGERCEEAKRLAERLNLPYFADSDEAVNADLLLVVTSERLELHEVGSRAGAVYAEFVAGKAGYRRTQPGRAPVARAAGVKGAFRPTVLDATAGLGQDAFTLAMSGCRVHVVERSSIIAALLADGVERALAYPETAEAATRLSLVVGEAKEVLVSLSETERPDTVYLDPMYPETGKKAAKRKEMRLFRRLVGDDLDAGELLTAARHVALRRVVVKRPTKAPPLNNQKPDAVIPGKTTRFDLYFRSPIL